MNYGENMHNADAMRMTGVCIFAVAIVQLGVSSAAYDLTTVGVGSWWAGMIVAVTGIFAMLSKKRCAATLGIALSVAALVLCFVGTIIDGLNSAVFRDFDICYNPGTNITYGDQDITNSTLSCMRQAITHTSNQTYGRTDCICASNGEEDRYDCIDIQLRHNSENCEKLLTIMPELLLASCLILLACLFLVMFYSCMSCRSVCCTENTVVPDAPVPANASYYVVSAVEQPPAVILSHAEINSSHIVDLEQNDDNVSNNDNTRSSTAQGGTYTATITAYPVKG